MTHQNHQTNGASLEDCHTNFFALTDLCGIKWRKFANGERPNASSDPLDDPILRSYSRCMQADILCVWRRVQSTKQDNSDPNALPFEISPSKVHPPLSLAAAKELWIFWYGEEPDLCELVDAELLKVAANQSLWNGTWERGLTYECRSLLFKALHNLMERFVLTKDIVRFGKWFVQPCTSSDRLFGRSSQHLSFSFTFFVHGDTVCASIDLREHPAVRPLTKEHLVEAAAAYAAASSTTQSHEQNSPNSLGDVTVPLDGDARTGNSNNSGNGNGNGSNTNASPKPRKVILAPFGMAATLTGNSYKPTDPMAEKILEDWASFFPLCNKQNSDMPPVVEVVSGGHKMYHPSIYVLVTDLDDMEEMEAAASQKGALGTTSSTEAAALAALSTANTTGNIGCTTLTENAVPKGADTKPIIMTSSSTSSITSATTFIERLTTDATKVQPYYDTLTSSFTCNTTNTHAPPQAATEMPERAWQDCLTNAQHVALACANATISNHGDEEGIGCSNQIEGSTNNNSSIAVDSKQKVQQQLQQQQQQQIWGFVDPTEKAPCICTKYRSSNKKTSSSTITTTGATVGSSAGMNSGACSPASSLIRMSSTGIAAINKSHVVGISCANVNSGIHGSNSGSHFIQQHQHYHQQHHYFRPTTPYAATTDHIISKLARSTRISFHKRPQFEVETNAISIGMSSDSTNVATYNSKCSRGYRGHNAAATATFTFNSNSNLNFNLNSNSAVSTSVFAAFGGTFYKTSSDTLPKQRALVAATLTATPHGTPHGGASTYSRNSIGDSMPVPSVGSPGTPAPSPHPNSSLSQPTSVPPADQLLNMSPRAPTSVSNLQQPTTPIDHLLDKNTPAPTPTDQHDNKSITASPYVHPTPSVEAPPSAEGTHGNGGQHGGPGSVPQPPSVGRCTPTMGQQSAATTPQHQQQPQCGTISVKKFEVLTPLEPYIKLEPGCAELTNNCGRVGALGTTAAATAAAVAATAAVSDVINDFYKLYKPPKLTIKDIDSVANDDCLKLDALYDFSAQDAWANHPMKRFKPNEVFKPRRIQMRSKNLYEGHTHFRPPMPSPGSMYGAQLLCIDAESTATSNLDATSDGGVVGGGGLVGIVATSNMDTSGDGIDGTSASGFYPELDVKTEVLPGITSPCKEAKANVDGNLFTAEGLKIPPNLDMEDLFERSSNNECSNVQMHTPPDSNNPSNGCASTANNTIEDLKRGSAVSSVVGVAAIAALQNCTNSNTVGVTTSNVNNSSMGPNNIPAEDLTKMFPTPPSHEQHHPNSSPCQMDIQMTDLSVITSNTPVNSLDTGLGVGGGVIGIGAAIKIKQEYSVELGSPAEESIEDWSYVYMPPQRAKFVGSSKYAPLTNLPSQTLPPLVVPANSVYKPSWTKQQSRAAAVAAAAQAAAVQQQQLQQQQQQHQQHQQLHELLSSAPRTPLQQPRTPLGGPMPSPMHCSSTVPTPLSSGGGGSNLLLNQLNCPQAALTNTPGGSQGAGPTMQQLMQRAGMSPISPAPAASSVPFPRGSPMLQAQRQTPIHPPPPYEMAVASPATSTSSYLNKQYHSQEPPQTPQSVGGAGMIMHPSGPHSAAAHLSATGMCPASAVTREIPEVSSLIVNILLYDTALNVFRDHNFDSSTVCVCNADSQKVGNIRGADSGVYVPLPGSTFNPAPTPSATANAAGGTASSNGNMRMLSAFGGGSAMDSPLSLPGAGSGHMVGGGGGGSSSSSSTTPAANHQQHIAGYVDDDPVDCTCGFSAVVNRRLAYRAGLFYEDEMEITGIAEDPGRRKKQSLISVINSLPSMLRPTAAPASASSLTATSTKTNALASVGGDKANAAQAAAEQLAHDIFDLLLEQCSIIQTTSSSIHRALQRHRRRLAKHNRQPQSTAAIANVLEFVDANDIMCLALEQARLSFEANRMDINEFAQQHQLSPFQPAAAVMSRRNTSLVLGGTGGKLSVHKWPYIPVGFTRSNKDIVRTMNSIQPMLQNAFHSKSRSAAGTKDATYTVSGPLTWRQFHRLAGRASGQCEPQPIPSVIVGHDKDWISVAPLAIHYWDKFLLEPYSYARDVVYLIICPANEYVVANTKTYFKELSSTYEMCKLGRHTPMRGWDGILTVGGARSSSEHVASTSLDDWLRTLDDASLSEKIRLYAHAFQHMLAPYLSRVATDKTLLNPPEHNGSSGTHGGGRERGNTSPLTSGLGSMHGVGNAMDAERPHISPKLESGAAGGEQPSANSIESGLVDSKADIKQDVKPAIVLSDPLGMGETMEDINPPAIVLYVVEPFTFGSDAPELERLACIALLRCYSELLKSIPESVRANINIQIISLESILELGRSRNRKRFSDEIKCLALNIFSQCRRHMVHAQTVKSLTGFGTAANMEVFLKSKDEKNRQAYKMYTPPYILAPVHEKNDKTDFSRISSSMRGLNEQKYSVLYCNYCMSEDQSWLLATVTDDRGELLEKVCINIDVPNRMRRRKAPARRVGLKKLMDYLMGLISQTAQTWRLVIGRIGRIGHSELKSWSYLLGKQNLQKASKQLKDMCKQCTLMHPPSILSACLVTLEPDAKLRVMPDQFTPDERFSQISMQNPLSTPQDVTCTHILVFPTSAVCLSFTRQFQNEPQVDLDNDFLNFEECEDDNEGFSNADLMGDLLGDWEPQLGPMSNHGSPDRMEDNRSWQSAGGNNFNSTQQQDVEEVGSINQQPLAVGYMVSTAPTGRMPSWFWAACPHLEDVCPVFLKTALHLHVPNIQTTDDILNSTNAHSSATDHPLDSTLTADVLRYVLEGYNALSWLALDSNTHDRLSCLPINVQMLMDLYYLTAAIA